MRKVIKKIIKNEDGAAAIEAAFALPIIIILSFMFFELCYIAYTQSILNYSSAQGSRYAMVNIDQKSINNEDVDLAASYLAQKETEIEEVVKGSFILVNPNNVSDVSVTLIPDIFTTNVNVSIEYNYTTSVPILPNFNFTLNAVSGEFLAR